MSDYYAVQVETIYITNTGAALGLPCRLSITGVNKLQGSYRQKDYTDFIGNPVAVLTNVGTKGKNLEIRLEALAASVVQSLEALHETARATQVTLTLQATDDYMPDFTKEVMPAAEDVEYDPERDVAGNYTNVVLRYRCVN